jgi:PAS domain S-box-containing protein
MRVLVADDDPVWRQLVTAHLQRHGYEAVPAVDGTAAAALLNDADAPRLALLDWVMPGADGVELCRRIRSRKSSAYTYLIILTSKTDRDDIVAGLASGADDYLTKPFHASELIARLRVGERVIALHDEVVSAHRATQTLVIHAPFGIASLDSRAHICDINPAFLTMLGHKSPEAVTGLSVLDFFRDAAQRATMQEYLSAGGRFDAFEAEWRHRDGHSVFLRLVGRPLRQDSSSVCFELIAEDVTQRFVLEQQCRQGQRLEAIGRFSGSIAHDFNNLLSVIKGCTELLLPLGRANPDAQNKLQSIMKASDDAAGLIQQLLAFSRRQVLRPEPLDLNQLVVDFSPMLHRLSGEEIEFRTELEPGIGLVLADPGQVRQVLMNLVVNARDAMPSGGRLLLKSRAIELDEPFTRDDTTVAAGNYTSISVVDTGCGMDSSLQAHIFEPFFTTKGERGTGLGLATTYGIVKQSHGYIWVNSAPGAGSTFEVWLPTTTQKVARTAHSRGLAQPCQPATVLLVEDELPVREVARECLEAAGITVLEAQSPAEAMQVAGSHLGQIDLLLTDVVMPEMRGNELADRLRQQQPNLKVLFMSGYAYDSAISKVSTTENTGFLQKPFSIAGLHSRVSELLNAKPTNI